VFRNKITQKVVHSRMRLLEPSIMSPTVDRTAPTSDSPITQVVKRVVRQFVLSDVGPYLPLIPIVYGVNAHDVGILLRHSEWGQTSTID